MERTGEMRAKRIVLLFGAFLFAQLAERALHELGHAVATWLTGGVVFEVFLHPFLEGHCVHSATAHPTFTTLAGAGFGVGMGVLIFLAVRRRLRPSTALPAMIASAALLSNGFYYALGVFIPFGDPLYLYGTLGFPRALVLSIGLAMIVGGSVAAAGTLGPVFGFDEHEPAGGQVLMLAAGILPLSVVSLVYRPAAGTGGVQTALGGIAGAVLSVLLIALAYRLLATRCGRFRERTRAPEIRLRDAAAASICGLGFAVFELLYFRI